MRKPGPPLPAVDARPLQPLPGLKIDALRSFFAEDQPLRVHGPAALEWVDDAEGTARPHALVATPLSGGAPSSLPLRSSR